jgi:hypothetical protein
VRCERRDGACGESRRLATTGRAEHDGPEELQRPKLSGSDEALCSLLFATGVTRTNAPESLVIPGRVRGLSNREIEAALAEVLGSEAALLTATLLLSCQRIHAEFDARKRRDRATEVGDHAYRRHFTPDIISRPRR